MPDPAPDTRLDVAGLLLAGLINTFLAAFVATVVVGPGTSALQPDPVARAAWIAAHPLRWGAGWLFWFAVTLSFSWSYFALGRHLDGRRPWPQLAIGVALIAAAVDCVGIVINLAVLPDLAQAAADPAFAPLFGVTQTLAYALVNVAAFGLYSAAGLLLLPALFATTGYPRPLAWLGAAEWTAAAVATLLLLVAPTAATAPLLLSFALFAPWVWGSAYWLARR